jgi:putative restriction endonuclease
MITRWPFGFPRFTSRAHLDMGTNEGWFTKLGELRPSRGKKGDQPAPHKPLLLLVLFELAEQGQLPCDTLPLTPELTFQFCTFWRVVAHRRTQRPDIRLPFHHLQTNGFWRALDGQGNPSPHRSLTRSAKLDPGFVTFMHDPESRRQSQRLLIARYFPRREQHVLYALVGMDPPSDEQIEQDASAVDIVKANERGRDARFRLNVVAAYKYTCALTGYRLTTISSGSIVDAAHIHQFADSRNNDPKNGLALCKNAHWLFDNGLWTISDDYTVRVAFGRFAEDSPNQTPLSAFDGRGLHLPADRALWPDPVHLAWHRKHKFQTA